MNIYFTTETPAKLASVIANIKNYYVFDVQTFIEDMHIDPKKPANIYFINNEITNTLMSISKLKKYLGIIYVNKNVTENLIKTMRNKFGNVETIDKFVLIDNINVVKHKDLHNLFEEIYFYERFKKVKM